MTPETDAGHAPRASLSATLEDYLETILALVREGGVARSRDIAARLDVHKSTVTAALRSLGDMGLVNYAPYEVITLTPEGERRARDVRRRHDALRSFFVDVLDVRAPVAERAACAMEHVVPPEVLRRMADFTASLRDCPCGRAAGGGRAAFKACVVCVLKKGAKDLPADVPAAEGGADARPAPGQRAVRTKNHRVSYHPFFPTGAKS